MSKIRILTAGDSALIVEFGNTIDEGTNDLVQALKGILSQKENWGIKEVVPTFRSLLVLYDVHVTSFKELSGKIEETLPELEIASANGVKRIWQIPCCYEEKYAPDLKEMAELLSLSEEEIISIHSSREYKIYMLGFLPGFVYLGGMDERIAAPRLSTPRIKIPKGAVAIGGSQTGVYPIESPGGWRIIGATPADFYNVERETPILCSAGDYIRFVPITSAEYERLLEEKDYLPECVVRGAV